MPRSGLSPERVVTEAAMLADEAGLGGVTFAALAGRLGVRAPSLYKHVTSVDAVQGALAVLAVEELAETVAEAVAGRSGAQALRAAGAAYVTYARAHPGRYPLLLRAPAVGDHAHVAAGTRVIELLRATLRELELDPDDELHAIRMIRSALHGFCALEAGGGFGLDLDTDVTLRRFTDVLWAGLS